RVPGSDEVETALAVERGTLGVEEIGELRLRKREVESRESGHQRVELLGILLDAARELVENALDLVLLRELGLAERVVRLEDLERLDEHGRAGGRLVVDDPFHRAAHLRAHRHDVAPAALRDDRLLERARELAFEQAIETLLEPRLRGAELGTQAAKARARAIEDLARAGDRVLDRLRERARRPREFRERRQRWIGSHVGEELLRRADRVGDGQQLSRV